MGFTTPCFIYKNTLKLQGKLKYLGYVEHPTMMNVDTSSQFLICNRGFFVGFPIGYQEEIDSAIDCGTNEELFLAIAALRDDTDKFQWFTDGCHWEKCPYEVVYINAWIYKCECSPHKATVEELINHFVL
jgi:hypothetical protein|uniref:Uncharacterized protein n=1 Tax=Myoviridae sp. ctByu2 TaxID=2827668 RepID=A0A8S5S9M2_9CAUD|nr:MAG TPA: hypothetical protein [Myoviridae sp. ctByu2]